MENSENSDENKSISGYKLITNFFNPVFNTYIGDNLKRKRFGLTKGGLRDFDMVEYSKNYFSALGLKDIRDKFVTNTNISDAEFKNLIQNLAELNIESKHDPNLSKTTLKFIKKINKDLSINYLPYFQKILQDLNKKHHNLNLTKSQQKKIAKIQKNKLVKTQESVETTTTQNITRNWLCNLCNDQLSSFQQCLGCGKEFCDNHMLKEIHNCSSYQKELDPSEFPITNSIKHLDSKIKFIKPVLVFLVIFAIIFIFGWYLQNPSQPMAMTAYEINESPTWITTKNICNFVETTNNNKVCLKYCSNPVKYSCNKNDQLVCLCA